MSFVLRGPLVLIVKSLRSFLALKCSVSEGVKVSLSCAIWVSPYKEEFRREEGLIKHTIGMEKIDV